MRSLLQWWAEKRPSGAKAHGDSAAVTYGLKPVMAWMKLSPFKAIRVAQAGLLAIAICFSLGATDAGSRYTDLNHRLMCTCGCAEILGECNHVGCPNSTGELNELKDGIAAGQSDKEILNSFVGKYGAVVLAAPTGHGFDVVAWIAPFAVFAAATLGTILLVRRWSVGKTQIAALDTAAMDPAAREIREKIRRETGDDGGF